MAPRLNCLLSLTVGALVYEAGGAGPEADLIGAVLSCGEVDFCELRGTSFAFPYCGCSPLGEVGVVDL